MTVYFLFLVQFVSERLILVCSVFSYSLPLADLWTSSDTEPLSVGSGKELSYLLISVSDYPRSIDAFFFWSLLMIALDLLFTY